MAQFESWMDSMARGSILGHKKAWLAGTVAVALLAASLSPATARPAEHATPAHLDVPNAQLVRIVTDVNQPNTITNAGDGSGRVFINLQDGKIIIWNGRRVLPTPLLDIDPLVGSDGSEQGLLGLAFHPHYATTGYFYVDYTDNNGDTVIARYHVSANDPNIADPNSALILLVIDQPYANHNGGQLAFGPDGYLYIGLGDGGSEGDPGNRGQDTTQLLGKILRIDVNNRVGLPPDCGSGSNYTIPADNPLADGRGGNCDEIWQTGLRNPWRFSFDRATGDMYIGDVGQNFWEEIDYTPAGNPGGQNFGWRCFEGNHPFNTQGCGPSRNYVFPILEYSHTVNGVCAVTGGYVYHGSALPRYVGAYFYGDYCGGQIWVAKRINGV